MAPRDFDEGREGQPFLESMPSPAPERFVDEDRRVLVKIGNLSPDQKNQPSYIKPDEKDNHDSKTRIHGGVTRRVSHKCRESHSDELPQKPRCGATNERRTKPHLRVR